MYTHKRCQASVLKDGHLLDGRNLLKGNVLTALLCFPENPEIEP
jgi:hypothetical protein